MSCHLWLPLHTLITVEFFLDIISHCGGTPLLHPFRFLCYVHIRIFPRSCACPWVGRLPRVGLLLLLLLPPLLPPPLLPDKWLKQLSVCCFRALLGKQAQPTSKKKKRKKGGKKSSRCYSTAQSFNIDIIELFLKRISASNNMQNDNKLQSILPDPKDSSVSSF